MTRLKNPIEIKFYFRFIRIEKLHWYLKEVIKKYYEQANIYNTITYCI